MATRRSKSQSSESSDILPVHLEKIGLVIAFAGNVMNINVNGCLPEKHGEPLSKVAQQLIAGVASAPVLSD